MDETYNKILLKIQLNIYQKVNKQFWICLKLFSFITFIFVVKIRVISLNQSMRPSDTPIRLEIRNPQDLIVKVEESAKSDTGFITETFRFPTHPPFGTWSVVAYYGHKVSVHCTVMLWFSFMDTA